MGCGTGNRGKATSPEVKKAEEVNPPAEKLGSVLGYKKILSDYAVSKKLYDDPQFPATADSAGPALKREASTWERIGADVKILARDGIPTNVNCGRMPANLHAEVMATLTLETLKNAILCKSEDLESGAALVKIFNENGLIETITVDTRVPVVGPGNPAFCKSKNTKECWPALLEKALAKKYGSYESIIYNAGVADALSLFSYGSIVLSLALNPGDELGFQNSIKDLRELAKNGHMQMIAKYRTKRDPPTTDPKGLQMHLFYGVTGLYELPSIKLVKLHNPQEVKSVIESGWQGQYGNNSPLFTEEIKRQVDWRDTEFCMRRDDFLKEFENLHVSFAFNDKVKCFSVRGEFESGDGAGMPTRDMPTLKVDKNPQYSISVGQNQWLFIEFRQLEREANFQGKREIYLGLFTNQGKKIESLVPKPTTVKEVPLEKVAKITTYMRTSDAANYTLMLSNKEGDAGKYYLRVFSTDSGMKVQKL